MPHRSCGAYSKAALINFSTPCAALNRGRRLFGGGAYLFKISNLEITDFEITRRINYSLNCTPLVPINITNNKPKSVNNNSVNNGQYTRIVRKIKTDLSSVCGEHFQNTLLGRFKIWKKRSINNEMNWTL